MAWMSKQKFFKSLPADMKSMFTCPEYIPVMKMSLVKDGKIYVQTYKEKDNLSEFFILDFNGKVLKKVFLPVDIDTFNIQASADALFTFHGGKCYYLIDDPEKEKWGLYMKKMD